MLGGAEMEMSELPLVKLHYGPYITNGILRHKTQRLQGLIQGLSSLEYIVKLVPSIHTERLSIEMRGREIYRCNIKSLQFNIKYKDDANCLRLINIIQEARARMYSQSDNYSIASSAIKEQQEKIQKIADNSLCDDIFEDLEKSWYIPHQQI